MKHLYFFLSILLFSNQTYSQDAYLMAAVDTAPVIGTCYDPKDTKDCFNKNLNHHIQTNLDLRKTYHAAGKAYVQFIVSAEGEVQDVKVRAEDDKHREEAKRVIQILKVEEPATLNGEKVAVMHSLPISFRTKNYNSMQEYQKSKDYKKAMEHRIRRQEEARKAIVPFEEVAFPPEYAECETISDKKECFQRFTEIKLRMHLQKENPKLKPGDEIRYLFQVDTEGKVENVLVNGPGKLTNRLATNFLKSLTFEQPAKNSKAEPVKTEFTGKLVL